MRELLDLLDIVRNADILIASICTALKLFDRFVSLVRLVSEIPFINVRNSTQGEKKRKVVVGCCWCVLTALLERQNHLRVPIPKTSIEK